MIKIKYIVNDNFLLYKQSEYYLLRNSITNEFIRFTENEYRVYRKFKELNTLDNLTEYELEIFNVLNDSNIIIEEGKNEIINKENFNIFNFTIKEISAGKLLNKIKFLNKYIFTKAFAAISTAVIILSILSAFILNNKGIEIFKLSFYSMESVGEIIAVYLGLLITVAIHELSHALTLLHNGLDTNVMGIKLYFLQPIAYCDLNELYLIEDKSKKISTYVAGVVSQIICSSIIMCIYASLVLMFRCRIDGLAIYAGLNLAIAIFNMIPFVKFDGYWIASAIFNTYNLEIKAQKELRKVFKKKEHVQYSLATFGALNICFKIFLITSTLSIFYVYFK